MLLYIFLIIAFCANVWLGWILSSWLGVGIFLGLIPVTIIVTLGGGLALGLAGMIFGKHSDHTKGKKFLRHFLREWAWLIGIAWIFPWVCFGLLQFQNNVAPATLPKITISNGEKKVVFQSMMHIASRGFYDDIRTDIENLKGRDYVFFYEGVQQGTPASMEKLSKLMGINISEEMYALFAQMGGLSVQNPDEFVGIIPSTNVDLTTDQIVALSEGENIPPAQKNISEVLSFMETRYVGFNNTEKYIARTISRGALNVLLRTYADPSFANEVKQTIPVFDIILDKRNEHLVDAIIASPVPNIYIHYGAMHYAGVLKLLKEKDSRWEEIAKMEYQVIR